MKREELSETEIREIYDSDTLERDIGDVFWHDGVMFMVAEADGNGCDGCSLYAEDDYPCLMVHYSGACTMRADGKDVVFVAPRGYAPKRTKAFKAAVRAKRREEREREGMGKDGKKKGGKGRAGKNLMEEPGRVRKRKEEKHDD